MGYLRPLRALCCQNRAFFLWKLYILWLDKKKEEEYKSGEKRWMRNGIGDIDENVLWRFDINLC